MKWQIFFLELNGRSRGGTLGNPAVYFIIQVQASTKEDAIRLALLDYPDLVEHVEVGLEPAVRKFDIPEGFRGLAYALCRFDDWKTRDEVRIERRRRADELIATYQRPAAQRALSDLPSRICNRIKTSKNGCWIWHGILNGNGYGVIWDDGTNWMAHA